MASSRSDSSRPNTLVLLLAASLTAMVAIVFARLAYGLILPSMRAELGLGYREAGNLGTITALGYFLFILPGGLAATRWGARNTVIGGLLLVMLAFIGLAVAQSYLPIAVLMFALGVGTAYCFAPMLSLLVTWYPERRGLMIGYMTAGIGAGLFLIGLLIPWLIRLFGALGWRVSWGVFAVVTAVAALLVLLGAKDPPVAGDAGRQARPGAERWRIYRNPRVLTVAVVYGIIGVSYIAQAIFMISFAEASGVASTTAGWLLSMSGLLSVISGPLWGLLSDRWGRGNTLLLTLSLLTAGMALPMFSQTVPAFFFHFVLFGLALNGSFTMVQAASTDQVAPRYIPIAFSYATLFFAGGQFIGPAIAGWLIEAGGFRAALGFTCFALLVGIHLTLRIRAFPKELAVV
ncbi:MAG: MFS transporter [Burkholderiaceae bacterium]